jgi:Tfp pilus assembly protein PilN
MQSGTNVFLIGSLFLAGLMIAVAIGTFAYSRVLQGTLAKKQAQLAAAQQKVDENTIEDFIRLRDRLSSGKDLLSNHIVLSQLFDALESITLQNVRFETLKITVAGDRSAKFEITGTAKNFNALAAQSNAFASNKLIKRAIFSGITLSKDNLVTFTLDADIDTKLIIEDPARSVSSQTVLPASGAPAPASLPSASSSVPAAQQAGTGTSTASRPTVAPSPAAPAVSTASSSKP